MTFDLSQIYLKYNINRFVKHFSKLTHNHVHIRHLTCHICSNNYEKLFCQMFFKIALSPPQKSLHRSSEPFSEEPNVTTRPGKYRIIA
jgi:hypothetical protein